MKKKIAVCPCCQTPIHSPLSYSQRKLRIQDNSQLTETKRLSWCVTPNYKPQHV